MDRTYFNNLTSNYEMFFTPAGSCQMDGIVSLYNYIMTYLTSILCIVTTALLFIIIVHIHGERHLKQFKIEEDLNELLNWLKYLQRWTHSTILELIWTIIPTLILIAIAIPSFILLYSLDEIVDTQSVVKIIAYQWYWKYEYPVMDVINDDVVTFSYLSYMLPFDDLTEEKNLRLLEVDAPLVLPTNVNSKLIITAKDVLHSFAIPALGIKMDAVPGRLNQVTVHIFKSGMFYGQCSELCGVNHGFMPIVLAAVDFNTFEHFLSECSGISTEIPTINESEKLVEWKEPICVECSQLPKEREWEEVVAASNWNGDIDGLSREDWLRIVQRYVVAHLDLLAQEIFKEEHSAPDVELPDTAQEREWEEVVAASNWNGGIDGLSREDWLRIVQRYVVAHLDLLAQEVLKEEHSAPDVELPDTAQEEKEPDSTEKTSE